jgi:hypothetical protein
MPNTLYSVGYLNPGALDLLQTQVDKGSLIVDIRKVATSRFRPEFSAKRLYERFGTAYRQIRDLGNDHYNQPGALIRLHEPERGIPTLLSLLEQQDCCLLCCCRTMSTCQTAVVVEHLRQACPDVQVQRLGEQPSLKCLSIRQPWAWIITHPTEVAACGLPPKTIENRDWSTRHRGGLLLHASATVEASFFDRQSGLLLPDYWAGRFGATGRRLAQVIPQHRKDYPTRAIVGYAELVEVVEESASPWFVGDYGFVLASAHALPPMNYPGQRMLFDVPKTLAMSLEGKELYS